MDNTPGTHQRLLPNIGGDPTRFEVLAPVVEMPYRRAKMRLPGDYPLMFREVANLTPGAAPRMEW